MAEIVLGPVLRHVGETDATVWLETDSPCEAEVLGCSDRTFEVCGHHYALVVVEGLEPAAIQPYEVALDGERRWPEPGSRFPPSVIRTLGTREPLEIVFGSCRVTLPHHPPYTLRKDDDDRGREFDALRALAMRMTGEPPDRWPELLLLLGDQVYVDEGSPQTREFIRSRRDTGDPPGEQAADFEEYTRLYRESWGEPVIRWLLSTVPSAMVIDDHDMADDWKISASWLEEMRATDWWAERSAAGLMTYWLYQHIGNLAPGELDEHEEYRRVRESGDPGDTLREFVEWTDRDGEGKVWSFKRELGRTRLVVADDRTGRVLREGERAILDRHEWSWLVDAVSGDFDHVVIGTTDPLLLAPSFHYLEAWSEAVCGGRWGPPGARMGEWARRTLDLDHWSAFGRSFQGLAGLLAELGRGEHGGQPASVGVLSGDVHHAYLAEVGFPRGAGVTSAVYQAVCSPFRNALDAHERAAIELGWSRPGTAMARGLARLAGVGDPEIRWRLAEGPCYDNQFATLVLDGRRATLALDKAVPDETGELPRIERVFQRRIA